MDAAKIEEVRQRAGILDVVGRVVSLQKKGKRYVGLCPFHNEKSASFSVSEDRGLYYCFGCHAGGDAFSFEMRYEGIDFGQAVRRLAERCGVTVEAESPEKRRQRERHKKLVRASEYALAYFRHQLTVPEAEEARQYLLRRKIPEGEWTQWRLGYGGTHDGLLNYLKAKQVPAELGAQAGFLSEDGRHSLFAGRVVIPVFSNKDLLAFGGRRLRDEDRGPKYVNSRESDVFHKKQVLFGWDQAQGSMRKLSQVVLVEGFFDVLACHRAGITQTVAALGTGVSSHHAVNCGRLAKEAVMLFDDDAAGQKAARVATERFVAEGLRALIAPLGKGDDPDSLVSREGEKALQLQVDKAQPAVEFFFDRVLSKDRSVQERAEGLKQLAPLIIASQSKLERDLYVARLVEMTGLPKETIDEHLDAAQREQTRKEKAKSAKASGPRGQSTSRAPASQPKRPETRAQPATGLKGSQAVKATKPEVPRPDIAELKLLKELMLYPTLRPRLPEMRAYVSEPMKKLLDDLSTAGEDVRQVMSHHVRDERLVAKICDVKDMTEVPDSERDAKAERTFRDIVNRLKERKLDNEIKAAMLEVADRDAKGEDTTEALRLVRQLRDQQRQLRRPQS